MFRIHKTLDIITLFHKSALPSSSQVLSLLKNVNESASAATETTRQDGKGGKQNVRNEEFLLDVTEAPPTSDQLRNILDYVAPAGVKPGEVVLGASDRADALKKLKESNGDLFVRPVVVDWINGKAVVGGNESEILKLVKQSSDSL